MRRLTAIVLLFSTLVGGSAVAQNGKDRIVVLDAWARASVIRTGAAYLTIENHGDKADRLIAVASPMARKAELHGQTIDGGIVRMRKVEAIEVSPGAPAVLRPGGLHIMLKGLAAPLKEGGTVPLVLTFERAGRLSVAAAIRKAGAMGSGDRSRHGAHKDRQSTH